MDFTHDTRLSLQALAALVNTRDPDTLTTVDQLDELCRRWQWSGLRTGDQAELQSVRDVRDRLAGFWGADEHAVVELINALLVEGRALPQLVKHDDFDWHIHATRPGAPLVVRMIVEYAMSMMDVVRAGDLDRLHYCAAPDCDFVVIDLSRNRSRRFCDSGCGNRANVAAYRARRRATG
ncbi:MAG TPA: CGNR zinc finger domain-containing protein [Micropruina sp.]|jgi:predicted RNA-binding Zn ribbon-like protein|nr:CGNR zinc finger domain-containing protein [Micropruina sp.]